MVIKQNAASTAEVLVVVDETELVTETSTYCGACKTFLYIAIECFLLVTCFSNKNGIRAQSHSQGNSEHCLNFGNVLHVNY